MFHNTTDVKFGVKYPPIHCDGAILQNHFKQNKTTNQQTSKKHPVGLPARNISGKFSNQFKWQIILKKYIYGKSLGISWDTTLQSFL